MRTPATQNSIVEDRTAPSFSDLPHQTSIASARFGPCKLFTGCVRLGASRRNAQHRCDKRRAQPVFGGQDLGALKAMIESLSLKDCRPTGEAPVGSLVLAGTIADLRFCKIVKHLISLTPPAPNPPTPRPQNASCSMQFPTDSEVHA